jgi:hypothetical protein
MSVCLSFLSTVFRWALKKFLFVIICKNSNQNWFLILSILHWFFSNYNFKANRGWTIQFSKKFDFFCSILKSFIWYCVDSAYYNIVTKKSTSGYVTFNDIQISLFFFIHHRKLSITLLKLYGKLIFQTVFALFCSQKRKKTL